MQVVSVWTEEEREAWKPPEPMSVSEWADAFRVLPTGTSSEPGAWRTDRTPFLRLVQDVMGDPEIEEVVLMKSPQVGGSEATRNALGFWIDQDPGPCLIVYPSEQSSKEVVEERILPMLKSTPRLERYFTGSSRDLRLTHIAMRTMTVYTGSSASPQALASRPIRYVICDEVDKYPPFTGREADPVSLAEARTRTYGHRRKLVQISTPTTKLGLISLAFQSSPVRLYYQIPCPHCQLRQRLVWSQLRWGPGLAANTTEFGGPVPETGDQRVELAQQVEAGQVPVWISCLRCQGRLVDSDKHQFLAAGQWLTLDNKAWDEVRKDTRKVAFHISSLYSPWVPWVRVVAEFLRSRDGVAPQMNFANNWLGEPYEEQLSKVEASLFAQKAQRGAPKGFVPSWARFLLASADTGGDHAWYTIRAWGPGMRSRLVDWGRVWNLEELYQKTLGTKFQIDADERSPQGVDLLVVDAGGTSTVEDGSRSDQVYRFSLRDPRIACVRGHLAATRVAAKPIVTRRITYKPPNGASPYDVVLNLLDVNYYKDVLSRRLHEMVEGKLGTDLWQESSTIDDEYCRQMVAEHRVLIREGRKLRATWQPLSKGLPNHFWDCAVYQCAAAEMIRVDMLGPYTPPREQPKNKAEERKELVQAERKIRSQLRSTNGQSFLANRRKK